MHSLCMWERELVARLEKGAHSGTTRQVCLQPKGYILAGQRPNARENMPFSNPVPCVRGNLSESTTCIKFNTFGEEYKKEKDLRSGIGI